MKMATDFLRSVGPKPIPALSQSRRGDMAWEALYVRKHVQSARAADSEAAAQGIAIHEILAICTHHFVGARRSIGLEVFSGVDGASWHRQQEDSDCNGDFERVYHHPLFRFNGHGDCLAAQLRPGNVHSRADWDTLWTPEMEPQQAVGKHVAFRADAVCAEPAIYAALEPRDLADAIRVQASERLKEEIADLLVRPPRTGQP